VKRIDLKQASALEWARQPNPAYKKKGSVKAKRTMRPIVPFDKHKRAAFYRPDNHDPGIIQDCLQPYADYLLNLIHWKTICWQDNKEGFVQLNAHLLNRVIPRHALPEIVNTLEAKGVIERDLKIARGKSMGYRLANGYLETHRLECMDDKVNRSIQRITHERTRHLQPIHLWQQSRFDFLEFDLERALAILWRLKPKTRSRLSVAQYRTQRAEYCKRIANKDYWFVCDKYGRWHTPITALERTLRCCLSVKGQPLVEIDLKNSQPLMLGIFARQYFRGRQAKHRFLNKSFDRRKEPYSVKEVRQMTCQYPSELKEYVQLCERGRFYEDLMTPSERLKGDKYREKFKKRFYRVLFSPNKSKSPYRNEIRIRFRHRWPLLAQLLYELKRKNYRHSSHVLQHYEATLFIAIICARIKKERPHTILFTIHDSILTMQDAVEYVRHVILDEFSKLGVTPSLAIKENR
jgi:hypothetical protein